MLGKVKKGIVLQRSDKYHDRKLRNIPKVALFCRNINLSIISGSNLRNVIYVISLKSFFNLWNIFAPMI